MYVIVYVTFNIFKGLSNAAHCTLQNSSAISNLCKQFVTLNEPISQAFIITFFYYNHLKIFFFSILFTFFFCGLATVARQIHLVTCLVLSCRTWWFLISNNMMNVADINAKNKPQLYLQQYLIMSAYVWVTKYYIIFDNIFKTHTFCIQFHWAARR